MKIDMVSSLSLSARRARIEMYLFKFPPANMSVDRNSTSIISVTANVVALRKESVDRNR